MKSARQTAPSPDGFDRRLLERYKPRYRLDSQEAYQPLSAASMTDNRRNALVRKDGAAISRPRRPDGLALTTLQNYPGGEEMLATDQLRHGRGRLRDAVRMTLGASAAGYDRRVYARVIERAGYQWLQYWSWHYHNPKRIIGFGTHEGDWELVQVALDQRGRPRLVTFAQHNGGEAREWEEVERADDSHVVVYVAPFSHAAYFEPGTQAYAARFLADNPDGEGPEIDPVLERFGRWAEWPGRWGRGTPSGWLFGGRLGNLGPESPGCQEERWCRPELFHAKARRRPRHEKRLAWTLGYVTYPREPLALEVVGVGRDAVRVRYKLRWFLRGARLLITIHDRDREGTPLIGSRWVLWPGRESEEAVTLLASPRDWRVVVRCSAFNVIDQRSWVVEAADGALKLLTGRHQDLVP